MRRKDLYGSSASNRASEELEYVIRSKKDQYKKVPRLSVEDALKHKRMLEVSSSRDVTRVLFISQNTELLNPAKQSLDGYIDLSDLFDEVHILILRTGIAPKNPVLRVSDNVWIYTASAPQWWRLPGAAMKTLDDQMAFASGFRPDLIVARDPFESAFVAYKVGKKYGRTTQLHILEDFTSQDFAKKNNIGFFRSLLPGHTMPHFNSVRTGTGALKKILSRKFQVDDLSVLPRYQDYKKLMEYETDFDLKEKYKSFVFVMLFVGRLSYDSTAYIAIDAARYVLKNPRVGMVVVGDGPSRNEFIDRAKILEIEKQVVFEKKVPNIDDYLKSANMLVVSDTDIDSEELVLKAAAIGVPMVMARTEKREDTFIHGESAFLCEADDVQSFTDRIDDLLNDVGLRDQFSQNAKKVIKKDFHHSLEDYKEEFRASIEQAFFVGDPKEENVEPTEGEEK